MKKVISSKIVFIFCFFVLFSFFYVMKANNFLTNCKFVDTYADSSVGSLLDGEKKHNFTIDVNNSNWKGITFFFSTVEEDAPFVFSVSIKDQNNEVVFAQTIRTKKDNDNYHRFTFGKEINASGTYTISIVGNNILLQCDENFVPMYKLYGNLIGKLIFPLVIAFFIGLLVIFAILFYFLFIKKIKIETIFLIGSIVFGLFFMVIMPPLTIGDECRHYDTAYEMSNKILGIKSQNGLIAKRVTDLSLVPDDYNKNENWTFFNYYEKLWPHVFSELKKTKDVSIVQVEPYATTLTHYPLLYVPSVIGLTLGRLLKLNFIFTFLLGRFFSLLTFVLVIYFALKQIKNEKIKAFFTSIALFPMVLHQIASFSYDSLLITLVFFFIMTLYSAAKEKKDLSILTIAFLCLATIVITPAKSVYFPIIAFVFLVPFSIYKNKSKGFLFLCLISASFVLGFAIEFLYSANVQGVHNSALVTPVKRAQVSSEILPNQNIINETFNVKWAIQNPFEYLYILMNTLVNRGSYFLDTAFARYLGWEAIPMNELFVFAFIGIFLFYLLSGTTKKEKLSKNQICQKYGALLLFVFVSGAIMTGFFIDGVDPIVPVISSIQGRYFIPILPLLFIFFDVSKEESNVISVEMILFQLSVQVLFAIDLVYRIVGIY